MELITYLAAFSMLSTTGWAQYVLEDDYMSGGDFFSKFSFWTAADPTNGFVEYQSQSAAQAAGLISSSSNNIEMKVASTGTTPNGRPSVRITSTETYQNGLVVVDIEHMPGGVCGTWPAFWMVGPNWPSGGEIDIIEGVNNAATNQMTLHTGPGCSISSSTADFSGTLSTDNCDINASGQATNAGCGIVTTNTQSYGSGFNSNGGGVYATEITSSYIAIWFFPRGSVPSDVESNSPNPSGWGTPMAKFEGDCDISSSFTNMQIVFDTTLCGSWAGEVWGSSSCASQASTCNSFVENNPSAFQDAYWSVNALKVYSNSGGSSPSPSASSTPSNTPVPSSLPISAPNPTTFAVSTTGAWSSNSWNSWANPSANTWGSPSANTWGSPSANTWGSATAPWVPFATSGGVMQNETPSASNPVSPQETQAAQAPTTQENAPQTTPGPTATANWPSTWQAEEHSATAGWDVGFPGGSEAMRRHLRAHKHGAHGSHGLHPF